MTDAKDEDSGSDVSGSKPVPPRSPWLRRLRRREAVGAAVLAAALTATFLTGRATTDPGEEPRDRPTVEVRSYSPRPGHILDGEWAWPTLGNRRGDRSHAREGLLTWLTVPRSQSEWFGEADPIWFRDEDGLEGLLMFSGTAPNGGHVAANETSDDEHVSVVALVDGVREYLVVYNPALNQERTGMNQERTGIATVPVDADMGGLDEAGHDRPPIVAPIPLVWNTDRDPSMEYGPGDRFTMAVPHWLTNLQVAGFGKDDSAWRPLRTSGDGRASVPIYKGINESTFDFERRREISGPDETERCDDGVLLRADEKLPGSEESVQVTYLYRPGFPYPVKLSYYPTQQAADKAQNDVAALDRPEMRYAAGALLCDSSGIFSESSKHPPAPFEVVWRPMWDGRPQPDANRMSVVTQDIKFAKEAKEEGAPEQTDRTQVVALGIDDPRDRRVLTDHPEVGDPAGGSRSQRTSDVGCLIDGDRVAVIGPKNAREVRLFDPASGHVWSGSGNVASFARDELPKNLTEVQAIAVTDDKDNRLHSMPCAIP